MKNSIKLERLRKLIMPNGYIPQGLQKHHYDKRYIQVLYVGLATELELAGATELGRELGVSRQLVLYYRKLHFDRLKLDKDYYSECEKIKANV